MPLPQTQVMETITDAHKYRCSLKNWEVKKEKKRGEGIYIYIEQRKSWNKKS